MSDVDCRETSQTLQSTCNVVPEHNHLEEGLDNGTPRGATSRFGVTNLVLSPRDDDENRVVASSITHETAGEKPMKKTWKARWGVLRSSMIQRTNGGEYTSCQIAKPIARSIQWVGRSCLCRDKDEDEPSDEMSRQSIRLVQV